MTKEINHTTKNTSAFLPALIFILFLTVVISAVLVLNLSVSTTENIRPDHVICITANAPNYSAGNSDGDPEVNKADDSLGFTASDNDTVWSTDTQINIFRHNDIHVQTDGTGSANNVIAPGTSNNYVFTLQNDKNESVKYQLEISGGNDSKYKIPVELSIIDPDGNNMLGNAPVLIEDLGSVHQLGTLTGHSEKYYTVKWQWVFENSTDEYDTLLGNHAVSEEIPCHININVTAEYDDSSTNGTSTVERSDETSSVNESSIHSDLQSRNGDKDKNGNNTSGNNIETVLTGDNTNAVVYIVLSVLCLTAIMLIVLINKKHKKND